MRPETNDPYTSYLWFGCWYHIIASFFPRARRVHAARRKLQSASMKQLIKHQKTTGFNQLMRWKNLAVSRDSLGECRAGGLKRHAFNISPSLVASLRRRCGVLKNLEQTKQLAELLGCSSQTSSSHGRASPPPTCAEILLRHCQVELSKRHTIKHLVRQVKRKLGLQRGKWLAIKTVLVGRAGTRPTSKIPQRRKRRRRSSLRGDSWDHPVSWRHEQRREFLRKKGRGPLPAGHKAAAGLKQRPSKKAKLNKVLAKLRKPNDKTLKKSSRGPGSFYSVSQKLVFKPFSDVAGNIGSLHGEPPLTHQPYFENLNLQQRIALEKHTITEIRRRTPVPAWQINILKLLRSARKRANQLLMAAKKQARHKRRKAAAQRGRKAAPKAKAGAAGGKTNLAKGKVVGGGKAPAGGRGGKNGGVAPAGRGGKNAGAAPAGRGGKNGGAVPAGRKNKAGGAAPAARGRNDKISPWQLSFLEKV